MSAAENWAIPKGSIILVTGVNGFIGSHIADQFLHHGFKVRGTVRNVDKNAWLADTFREKYGYERFELWRIPDMAVSGAFDAAVEGVSAVVHSASIMTLDHDPTKVIPGAIEFALNALKATYAEPSAKRFVFCSSSTAAVLATLEKPGIVVTEETWNEDAVKKAWADPPYTSERGHAVYSASKVLAEQAIWKYYDEHLNERPDIVVNTVLPNMTLGPSLDPVNQGYPSTASMVAFLYQGKVVEYHRMVPRQYFVDVQDIGRLHVAGAVLTKVRGQRIFGFAQRYSWDCILEILRNLEPDMVFPENFSGGEDPNEIEPRHKAEQLLRDLGQPGWTSLEESVRNLIQGLREVESRQTA
ncbi:hypothetical protein NUW58_g2649 [Xylaria curta]|uniref:Uncharacterized protein n=1 Tax=Xylaria curta TaxID=42375 RepID=A0ACC1PFW7_9PEZI|nr:hypothetical protein NUW58_g2649 [Xylaria curta]